MTITDQPKEGWHADVKLRLSGFECDPAEITKLLGLEPTHISIKGEPITRGPKARQGGVALVKATTWTLSQVLERQDIDPQVRSFLARFPSNLDILSSVTKTWASGVTLVYTLASPAPGIFLEKETLQRIIELGCYLNLDLYAADWDGTQSEHIEADIHYLTTEEGGRRRPIKSGYRGEFYYEGHRWDAVQTFIDREWVIPGEDVHALVSFMDPTPHRGKVTVDMPFEVREGVRVVGRGIVTRLLDL